MIKFLPLDFLGVSPRYGRPSLAAMFVCLLMQIYFFFVVVFAVCLLLSFSRQVIKQTTLQFASMLLEHFVLKKFQ